MPIGQSTETSAAPLRESANQPTDVALVLSTAAPSSLPEVEVTEPAIADAASVIENKADDMTVIAKNNDLPSRTNSIVPVNPVALASSQVEVKKAVSKSAPTTRLVISGVRPSRGNIRVAIYTDADSFPNPAGAVETFELGSTNPTMEASLTNLNQFAVAVYQDINADGELNRNRFGIPTEPFAFSNNAMGKRGPPSFEQAVVVQPAEAKEGGNEPFVVSIQLP